MKMWPHTTPVFRLQVADSCSDIADAVLRLCLRSMGMPGNALASVLDDLPPLPGVTPASLLQATSYNSAQLCMCYALSRCFGKVTPVLVCVVCLQLVWCAWCACNWSWF